MKGRWAKVDPARTTWDVYQDSTWISGGGTHMGLVRGNGDSSWVVHWHSSPGARMWLANPMDTVGAGYPVPLQGGSNIFCSGHATLPDGRLFVVGGTLGGVTGENRCYAFDAKTRTWQATDTTAQSRYYPTATTLGSGKVMAVSGYQWKNHALVGGSIDSSGSSVGTNDLRLLNLRRHQYWEQDSTTSNKPSKRHGHSSVYMNGLHMVYGGESGSATRDDLWHLYAEIHNSGWIWRWASRPTSPDPATGLRPPGRSRHSAVMLNDGNGSTPEMMIVFGGKNASGDALNDLWVCFLTNVTSQWKKITATGAPPSPRFGHVAVLAKGDRPQSDMLVYGGRDAAGAMVGDTVWVLTVSRVGSDTTYTWSTVPAGAVNPGKREGHSVVLLPVRSENPRTHRMVVFGGRKDGGTLDDEVYELRQFEDGNPNNWHWKKPTIPASPRPAARTRSAIAYDDQFNRITVFGGEASGRMGDLWELTLADTTATWAEGAADAMPSARWGHTLLFDPRPIGAQYVEVFDPAQGPQGNWGAITEAPKHLPYYPLTFGLSNGDVFYAGNGPLFGYRDTSWTFKTSTNQWSDPKDTGFLGGSAVMVVNPDTVLKFGGNDDEAPGESYGKTAIATFDSYGSATWNLQDQIPTQHRRTFHNLTLLPTGQALLTGGRAFRDGEAPFTRMAFIKNFGHTKWDSLDHDPFERGYHSSALLLPDGRVLCAGGPSAASLHGDYDPSVYEPPYLYGPSGAPATRPVITSHPTYTVHHGEPFYVAAEVDTGPSSIDSVKVLALIRPGTPTHGFDQNQRYVRVSRDVAHGMLRGVLTDNRNALPPGDYLLFAVRHDNVPSVAKWVRVANETDVTAPSAETITYSDVTGNSANLTWSAPGDDSTSGTATAYELRYRVNSSITEANFWSSTPYPSSHPKPVGATEQYAISGLENCTIYFFGLKTRDEAGNWSALRTAYFGTLGCGGGGSGQMPPSAKPVAGSGLPGLSNHHLLRLSPRAGALGSAEWSSLAATSVNVDSLAVWGYRPEGDTVTVVAGGQVAQGVRRSLAEISRGEQDIAARLASGGYVTSPGETVLVRRNADSYTSLAIVARPVDDQGTGIAVLERGRLGWWSRGAWTPSLGAERMVMRDVGGDSLRLVFHGRYALETLEELEATTVAAPPVVLPLEVRHSRGGTLSLERGVTGTSLTAGANLLPGDRLQIRYAPSPGTESRELYLSVWTSATEEVAALGATSARDLPPAFALEQNHPNPFGTATVIRFAVPSRSTVTLDVFDLHGRRIRSLARGERPAGHHAVEWDARDSRGRLVRPGIYLYRLSTGAFHSTRRMVLLP